MNNSRIRSIFILTALLLVTGTSAVFAQKLAPEALVADLYKQHNAKRSPFFQDKSRALVDKYFTKATADLIWKDSTTRGNEVGALDGDPLYDAQDTDIKKFAVGKPALSGEKATVTVTFENFSEKKIVTFALVMEKGAWKIDDISYNGGDYTLVGMLREDAGSGEQAEFEGGFQVGPTTCSVKPVKMAFEVKWARGTGVEMFFAKGEVDGKYVFESEPDKTGKTGKFVFDDAAYASGTYVRKDGITYKVNRSK
jgi:Protein of unknown function (DUF3828)